MLGMPLKFLHMYSGDYLVSFLSIFAALLLILNRGFAKEYVAFPGRIACPPPRYLDLLTFSPSAHGSIGTIDDVWLNASALDAIRRPASGRIWILASPRKWCSGRCTTANNALSVLPSFCL